MTITRPQVLFSLAVGLVLGGFHAANALAQATQEHSHAAEHGTAGHGPAGHGHQDASKTEKEISKSLATLSKADHKLAVAQRFCPIMEYTRLGADGAPHKVMVDGTPVFVCCEGCIEHAEAGGKGTLAKVSKLMKASATLAKMPTQERAAAEAQKYCAIANKSFLGSMGAPIKLEISGKPVYLCCKGCVKKANANPAATLAKAEALRKAGEEEGHGHEGSDHKGHAPGGHKH